jgi:ABC-type cobalamin/Fe3+-siderophores transport system ATPase subunit
MEITEIHLEEVSFYYPETQVLVFNRLSLDLPRGVTTLVGQNGTGKSTLLLLAAGILLPVEGTVLLQGMDTRNLREERERQRYVSFVYQNMEFETEEPIGTLLEYVYANGFLPDRGSDGLVRELIEVCELAPVQGRRLQEVSKGELQRAIIAFSILYGSKVLMMDEPIFALEDRQKHRIMEFLVSYVHDQDLSLFYSVHELDLSRRYSDNLLLFPKEEPPRIGTTSELFTRENIENAYQVPFTMLKAREQLYRRYLLERLGRREE